MAGLESTASLCIANTLKTRKEERKAKPQAKLYVQVQQSFNRSIFQQYLGEGWWEEYTLLLSFTLVFDNI